MNEKIKALAGSVIRVPDKDLRFVIIGILDLMEELSDKVIVLEEDNKRLRESLAKTMAGGGRALGDSNGGFNIG
jgi:hypothetical protein